jgi:hypothetical protein
MSAASRSASENRSKSGSSDEVRADAGGVLVLIVAALLVRAGVETLSSGQLHTGSRAAEHTMIHVEGLRARIIGLVFIAIAVCGAASRLLDVETRRDARPSDRRTARRPPPA